MNDDLPTPTSGPSISSSALNEDEQRQAAISHGNGATKSGLRAREFHRRFLNDLARNIDIVIYCQLSVLYYMDCSLFRFFIRAIPHWIFFTPKPLTLVQAPKNRPYVSSILLSNGFCALAHLLSAGPEASEATRGYLHGGMLIDFVGQLGPVSRWRLLLVDVFIVLLQVIILGITLEERDLNDVTESTTGSVSGAMPTRQDLDAEERGIRRSQENLGDEMEMAPLKSGDRENEGVTAARQRDGHPLDLMFSGQLVAANLRCTEVVRTAWRRTYGS